jgi:hypothetical protein
MDAFGGNSPKLARRREQFLVALLTAPSIIEAARKCEISETTARRWLAMPEVRERYQALRREAVDQALAQLQSVTGAAVLTLARNLRAESAGAQIRAALGIIEHAVRAVELADLQLRLEQLEALVAAQQQQSTQPHMGSPAIAGLRTMRAGGGGGSGKGGVA